jgi:hypothetical protein
LPSLRSAPTRSCAAGIGQLQLLETAPALLVDGRQVRQRGLEVAALGLQLGPPSSDLVAKQSMIS